MTVIIHPARTDSDIRDVTKLAWEFVALLKDRYPERAESIDEYLRDQRFDEMLADFRNHFTPPTGECLVARSNNSAVGIVMLKPVTKSLCEMNRMYVAPVARGKGIGRKLCEALIERAAELNYEEMRLGALDRHVEAIPLYRSLGFIDDPHPPEYALSDPGIIRLWRQLREE